MSHRYSRAEKGKGLAEHSKPRRKLPVRIPAEGNVARLEDFNLTLIGRVTNLAAQNTRALVDFFLHHWHVVGTITGRDLGPNLVQFNFESEQDLQSVLTKAPYHFKRWMLLLERWKPVVSDSFPAMIPFWIKVHGIPLHYWSLITLDTIGSELGVVEAKDVDHCRVRVLLNGLKPLEMKMDISLPSGDEIPVELKYEKLEKHCFHCFALSHEKKDCPLLPPALRSSSSHLGVTQLNTLDRLEANRRRLEDRRPPRQLSLSRDREWRREPSHSLHRSSDKTYVSDYIRRDYRKNYDSQGCYERDRTSLARRADDYSLSRSENQRNHTARPPPGHPPPPTWRPVTMAGNLKTPTQSIQSQVSHTPSPRPLREVLLPPGNATARNTGDHEPHSGERRSAFERISVPGHDTDRTEAQHEKVSSTKSLGSQQHGTEERRSALERLT